jgi:predicted enzyme related to lactoylglutathione lyase
MPYWLVITGEEGEPGIDGGLSLRENNPVTTNTIDVPDCDEYTEKIKAAGGKILGEKQAVPGVGYTALCQDTEGNMFGIMQEDENAK